MKKKVKDPFAIAHQLATKNVDPGYLHSVAAGIKRDPVYDRLLRAINPKIDRIEKEHARLLDEAPDNAEKLFDEFSDHCITRSNVWIDASFTLGIALGIRMAGGKAKGGRR